MTQRGPLIVETHSQDALARAQRGDAEAVGVLYDQHRDAILRYLWVRLGDHALAEDLTGDVFMRMLRALPNYRPGPVPFRAWLYRIARNLLMDYYRKTDERAAIPLHSVEAQAHPNNDLAAHAEQHLEIDRVRRALQRLDEGQREVVTLRFLAGLSLQETAAALDKTEAAIKALQHRGLAALRQALAEG